MPRRRLAIVGGIALAATVCMMVAIAAYWRYAHRYSLSEQTPLTAHMLARPAGHGGLSAVFLDLDVASPQGGSVTMTLRRASLGRTTGSYAWDWKGATFRDMSFIDLTKLVRQDGVVRAWDIEVATVTKMRLKVWRDWGSEWRVLAQSPVVDAAPGLNHFALSPALPIKAGDYVGLFIASGSVKLTSPLGFGLAPDLRNQSAVNLTWSSARGLQYNFPGDVAYGCKFRADPAPNPGYSLKIFLDNASAPAVAPNRERPVKDSLSIVDLNKEVQADAVLGAWEVQADAPSALRFLVWRPEGPSWRVVGQSRIERGAVGFNRFSLEPPLQVHQGDRLGFFTDWPPPGDFPVQLDPCGREGRVGKMYVPGDFDGSIAEATMARDAVAHYAFRGLTTDGNDVAVATVNWQVQAGRRTYRVPIPSQAFAVDEEVEVTLNVDAGTRAWLYPAMRGALSGQAYLNPEYGGGSAPSSSRITAPEGGWSLLDLMLIGLAGISWWSLTKRQRSRKELLVAGAAVVAAAAVWGTGMSGEPVALLAPGIVVMMVLPGFIVLELAVPGLASRLDSFERAPLLFGLSMAVWTVLATVAFRAQWSSDLVISGMLAGGFIGLAVVFWRRHPVASRPQEPDMHPDRVQDAYKYVLVAILLVVMAAVAWRAQFQGSGSDTLAHLAGYRKIADSATIVGGNPLLGPGYAYVGHYASNPWYLAFGLVARLAHVPESVPVLYICLTALLTGLSFLAFYALLKTFTSQSFAAALGTVIVIGPWVFEQSELWIGFHSYFYEFMGYQSTFTSLIIFPMLTAFTLRFVRDGIRALGIVAAVLAVATMGMHAQYLVWVPLLIGGGLVAAIPFAWDNRERIQILTLVAVIGLSAVAIGYCIASFSLADKPTAWSRDQEVALWSINAGPHGLWRPTATLLSQDPIEILDHNKAEVLGLIVLVLLGSHVVVRKKTSISLRRVEESVQRTWGLAVAALTILCVPWLIAYNPLIATPMLNLLHTIVPISRLPGANTVLAHVLVFGAVAAGWGVVVQACDQTRTRRFVYVIPVSVLVVLSGIAIVSPTGRQVLLGPLSNHAWYPSLLDLPNDSLYRGLSNLEQGVVAVQTNEAELVAALTHHYVVVVRSFRIGDSTITPQRLADNDAILNFSLPPQKMQEALQRVHCRYVVVTRGSAALEQFRGHAEMFREAFASEASVVFEVLSVVEDKGL